MKRIAITGANGFIGQYLCEYFLARGWQVLALCRQKPNVIGVEWQQYSLENTSSLDCLHNVDYLVHLAFAAATKQTSDSFHINLTATNHLLAEARRHGVKKFVYYSSMSAHEEAESQYGKHKWETEKLVEGKDSLILKPGLVLGEGGMLQKIGNMMKVLPIVPLIDGGKQPIQTISIKDLAEVNFLLLQNDSSGVWNLAENNATATKQFYKKIASEMGKKPIFLSVPYALIYALASMAEMVGITLPITLENLKGLKKLKTFDTTVSEKALNFTFEPTNITLSKHHTYLKLL